MLAATIGTTCDVQFQLFFEGRKTLVELFGEPTREALGFRQRQLAIF